MNPNLNQSSVEMKPTSRGNWIMEISIGSQLKSNQLVYNIRAIGVADEEEEDDDSGKIALIEEVNLEIPQLETLAAKVLS